MHFQQDSDKIREHFNAPEQLFDAIALVLASTLCKESMMVAEEPTPFLTQVSTTSSIRKDITGQRFERLFVVRTYRKDHITYAVCMCDCQPNVFITRKASYLVCRKTRSCGCLAREVQKICRWKNLVGQRFGRLIVVEQYRQHRQTYVSCQCDCGQLCTVWAGHLQDNHTQSCGCFKEDRLHARLNDLRGQRFGRLLVLHTYAERGRGYSECLCDCSRISRVRSQHLLRGKTKTCTQCDGPRIRHPLARRLAQSRHRASKKGLLATFTPAQQTFMYQYWGYACAICGRQEGFNWLIVEDHWLPLSLPTCPGTIATNMIPLCHGAGCCNNAKKNKEPQAWLIERLGPRQAKAKMKAITAFFAQAQLFAEREMTCSVA